LVQVVNIYTNVVSICFRRLRRTAHRHQQAPLVVLQASLEKRDERIAQVGTIREKLGDV
jgi:hypothetical protein